MLGGLLKVEADVCGGVVDCCGELSAPPAREEKLKGAFEEAGDGCEGCAVVCEVEEKLNEGFGGDGVWKRDGAGVVMDAVCWPVVEAGVPHGDRLVTEFVGSDGPVCVGKDFKGALSSTAAGFVKENRLAGGLEACSVLVIVSGAVTGFTEPKGFEEGLKPSLFVCWPKTDVSEAVVAEVDASEVVGFTEGLPKLKPVDAEGWPKPEAGGFG